MKKLLAVFCSLAIFSVSLFSTGIFTQNVSAEAEATEERFFHSFATAEDYNASKKYVNPNGTNITLSYDESEGALKAVPTTPGKANHQVRIDPAQGNTAIDVADYPVIAFKIKFNNVRTPAFGGVNIGTNKTTRPSGNTGGYFSYEKLGGSAKTCDWQLVVYDGKNDVWKAEGDANGQFCGKFEGLICLLTANGQTTTADDIFWIEWAGAFKTVDEVYALENEMVTPTPFLYDFEDETTTNNLINSGVVGNNGSGLSRGYDATEKALKLTPTGTTTNQFVFLAEANAASVADYPVIAMKVKFEDPSVNFAGIWPGTNRASGSKYASGQFATATFETGNYQIVIFDGTELAKTSTTYTGTWFGLLGRLAADNTTLTAEQGCYVQWAGAFKTIADAYAYDNDIPSPYFYNFEDEKETDNLLNKSKVVSNESSGISFNYDSNEKALKLTPSGTTANKFVFLSKTTEAAVEKYPVMAIKVKFADPSINFAGIWAGTNRTSGSKYAGSPLATNTVETGDWQLIVFDGSKKIFPDTNSQNVYTGTWYGMFCRLASDGTTLNANQGCWVQWAGVFESVQDAYAYDKQVETPIFYDYTTTENYNSSKARLTATNLEYTFSEEYSALKVTASNIGAVQHRLTVGQLGNVDNASKRISSIDYPVVAVKIRTNEETNITCWSGIRKNNSSGVKQGSDYRETDKVTAAAKSTDDWKILTFNYNDILNNYTTGSGYASYYWAGFFLLLTPDNTATTATQEWDIQWFGIFDSEASALAYDEVYFEDTNRTDTVTPADEDTNVLFVGDSASAGLLNADVKDVLGQDTANVNLGFLGSTDLNAAVSKGTDNMQFTYMAKNNRLTYTDSKTNSDAVQDFADWDYVFVQAGDNTAELLASAGTHLATNGKTVAYTAAQNADTSALTAGLAEVFDLNRVLYAAATKYTTADTIYTANGLTAAGNKLAALTLSDYVIDGYKALSKAVTVYDASAITDTLIKATITLPLAGDADNSSVIDNADITAIRNQILGAAATDNADTDLNGDIDIMDAVRVAVFLG